MSEILYTEEQLRIKIGKRIRYLRRQKDITQHNLANIIGIESASYICEIEKGRKSPSLKALHEIEFVLGPIWSEL